ncbi:hypothetical protein FIBSPDRAFT_671037, partial [Athelia psychrophila]
ALPDWIEEAMRYLLEMCNDIQWTALLLKWVELESQLGFLKGRSRSNQLSVTNRPAQIGIWIHQSRPWDAMPVIGHNVVEDYSILWWLWWRSLQPAWRAETLSRDLRGKGQFTWQETRKGSSSGFFLVILSLGWWL